MDQDAVTCTLIGMTLVTYGPRALPVWLLSSRIMPPAVVAWLRYVPAAVLAALLFPSLLINGGHISLGPGNIFLWAALPAAFVAFKTRSLVGSVLVGMAIVGVARHLFGI
jgi:branched-subunit amino acid transport protein